MSSIQKLLQMVTEYGELLRFLHQEHSDVLKEWKKTSSGRGMPEVDVGGNGNEFQHEYNF